MTSFTKKELELLKKSGNTAKTPEHNHHNGLQQPPANSNPPTEYVAIDVAKRIEEMQVAADQAVQGLDNAGYSNINSVIARRQRVFASDVQAIKDSIKFYMSPDAKLAVATIQAAQEISTESGLEVQVSVGKFFPELPEVPALPTYSRFYSSVDVQQVQQLGDGSNTNGQNGQSNNRENFQQNSADIQTGNS